MLAFQPFLKQVTSAVSESRKKQCISGGGVGKVQMFHGKSGALP